MNQPTHKKDDMLIKIGKNIIRLLFVAVITIAASTIASYATTPDKIPEPLSNDHEYWKDTARMNGADEVENPESVQPPTLQEKADEIETFVGIDLEAMQLYLYEDGKTHKSFRVVSKGEPDSLQETPSGQYKISERKQRRLAPTGDVYLPYSQRFFGNFFIHGQPEKSNGESAREEYAGGSIELETADAKELFGETEINMPVVIVGGTEENEEVSTPAYPAPNVGAKAYIVADIDSGEVFAQKRAEEVFPIASISKLMTAVVANETIPYNDSIAVSETAVSTYGAAGGLAAGERLSLDTLYSPLLLESSNDAATAIAEHKGFNNFMSLMNRKASALDMDSTHFSDPSGLSEGNISSARDLFRLSRYIHNKKKFIWDITTRTQEAFPSQTSDALRNFTNNNPMVGRSDFIGGKNGYTDEARHTLLSVFRAPVAGDKKNIAIIVLGSETHATDTQRLLNWVQNAV